MSTRNLIYAYFLSKLSNLDKKNNIIENEQLHCSSNSEDDMVDSKLPKELGKNTFLHSADNFGIMEKGKV